MKNSKEGVGAGARMSNFVSACIPHYRLSVNFQGPSNFMAGQEVVLITRYYVKINIITIMSLCLFFLKKTLIMIAVWF